MYSIFRFPTSLGLAVAIAVSVTKPGIAPAQTLVAVAPAAGDAGPLYRRAVEQMDAIGDANMPDSEPLNMAAAEAFLLKHSGVVERLRSATELPACTWNSPQELADTAMLGKLRHLGAIGMLQSRVDLAKNRPGKAVDDLLAVMSLSRHVGQTPLLVSKLVEIGIAEQSIKQLAAAMPALPKVVAATLPARLKKLPAAATSGAVILGEQAYALNMAKNSNGPPVGFNETAIRDSRGFYEAIAKVASQSPTEFSASVDAEVAKLQGPSQLFVATMVPALKPVRVPQAVLEAHNAMLIAAAEIVAGGEAKAAVSKDPFGDGPFGYARQGNGFRLTSKLVARGKPVMLTVGS